MKFEEPRSGCVTIAWPTAAPGQPVPAWLTTIHDAETGELLVDVVSLHLVIGEDEGWSSKPLEVELVRLVGIDGKPIGALPGGPVPTGEYREHMQREREQQIDLPFDGRRFLTERFRYLVVGASNDQHGQP